MSEPPRAPVDAVITRLGAKGDGIADVDGKPCFIPFALPGERWQLQCDEGGAKRLTDSPDRVRAPCPHFGQCGGCIAQHMSPSLYESWKLSIVREAFTHRGIDAHILPLARVPERTRRRAFFGVERRGGDVLIGFREEGCHTLVDMRECLLLDPSIVAALPVLRDIGRIAMPDSTSGRLIVTRLDQGLDVSFDNGHKMLRPDERSRLAELAVSSPIIRLTVAGDPIVMRANPELTIDGVTVQPPSGIFLQAVPAAELAMKDIVTGALPAKAKRAADLFSGLGTFTFPLARNVSVVAFDSDKRAITALKDAIRHAHGLKPIETHLRDLFREPLSPKELEDFDAVVLDPPRAGAAEQAARLARSRVPVVIAVSCAPATLARDARTLIDGGYRMGPVQPIDQFVYSPHVEAVTVFERVRR